LRFFSNLLCKNINISSVNINLSIFFCLIFKLPIVDVTKIKEWTGFTRHGAYKVIDRFIDLGILELKDETKKYGKIYIYRRYVDIFTE